MTDELCIATVRCLAADIIRKANSGHPGAAIGCAPIAHLLFSKMMKFNSADPQWMNRDRFVLSNGHGSALLYSMLYLCGYNVHMNDLQKFRQLRSVTPGHPECHLTEGVEVTTGPLGQGLCNAVGMAIAGEHLGAVYNRGDFKLFEGTIYCICGDGCLMEGVTHEACSLAGHLGLGNLIVFYDDNKITIDGSTDCTFTENVTQRFESYGWHVQEVPDCDTASALGRLEDAVINAKKNSRPSLIRVKTTIGYGSQWQGTSKVHGSPLQEADIENLKRLFGFDPDKKFFIPDEVRERYQDASHRGAVLHGEWNEMLGRYAAEYPNEYADFSRRVEGRLPVLSGKLPDFSSKGPLATRQTSSLVLAEIAKVCPEILGGSADLLASNLCKIPDTVDFTKDHREGRYIKYGVREHGMCAISNGLAAFGCLIPFSGTFLVFAGYALGAIRVGALSHNKVIHIFTHDSVGVGEDGPTHQPVETLASLRALPNLNVIRPADGRETNAAYLIALGSDGPSVLALSRQGIWLCGGAYVIHESVCPEVQIIATGTEVCISLDAAKILNEMYGIQASVVSMPCWEVFLKQDESYRKSVVQELPTVTVEAGSSFGWSRFASCTAKWRHIGVEEWGVSAPYGEAYDHFGLTKENIAIVAHSLVGK